MIGFIAPLIAASAMLGVPVTGPVPKDVAPPPPPYAGVYQPNGVDEIGVWNDADEDERILANAPIVIRDEALNAYVRQVLCDTVGTDRCKSARIYILRTPIFNASMMPNGAMRVLSGLLLRARNEAELGAVLGHEFGHFERRHSLFRFKAQRSATDLLSWASVLSATAATYGARSNFDQIQLSVYGSFYHFNRDQEREADRFGVGYLNASALRPQAASVVWQNIIAEAEASAKARGLKSPGSTRSRSLLPTRPRPSGQRH